MEYGTAEYNLRLREVQALEKIAESLNLISTAQASMALSPNNTVSPFYYIPRDIHITSEGSDKDGSKT